MVFEGARKGAFFSFYPSNMQATRKAGLLGVFKYFDFFRSSLELLL
jgi:hypothetical protein